MYHIVDVRKMTYHVSKMRLTLKRTVQALFLAILFSFSTLAMLRTFAASSSSSTSAVHGTITEQKQSRWMKTLVGLMPDRSLRSVDDVESNSLLEQVAPENNGIDELGELKLEVSSTPSTTTSKPVTSLDDVFISVKTTKNFHATRLDVIIKTWFTLAREQVDISFRLLFLV